MTVFPSLRLSGIFRIISGWPKLSTVNPLTCTSSFRQVATCAPDANTKGDKSSLDFGDYRTALKSKNWRELTRALLVLTICSNQTFSANSLKVRQLYQNYTDALLIRYVMIGCVCNVHNLWTTSENSQAAGPCFVIVFLFLLTRLHESKMFHWSLVFLFVAVCCIAVCSLSGL